MQRYENKCKGLAAAIFISLKNNVRPNTVRISGVKILRTKFSGSPVLPKIKFRSIIIPAPAHIIKMVLKKLVTWWFKQSFR